MDKVATGELTLTEQDISFVAAKSQGLNSMDALIQAYPDDSEIQQWADMRNSDDGREREYAKLMLRKKANLVNHRRPVEVLTQHYQERIIQMGEIALDTMEEIMIEGRSEKVRADVAIEVARQNIGNPDKDKSGNQNVIIMIGSDPAQQIRVDNVMEGEVVNG